MPAILLFCRGRARTRITYQDNILPLIQANCAKCHNEDKKKADLDLTSYQGALKGSGSGAVLVSGNPMRASCGRPSRRPKSRPCRQTSRRCRTRTWRHSRNGFKAACSKTPAARRSPAAKLAKRISRSNPMSAGKPDGPPPMPDESAARSRRSHGADDRDHRPGRQPVGAVDCCRGAKASAALQHRHPGIAWHSAFHRRDSRWTCNSVAAGNSCWPAVESARSRAAWSSGMSSPVRSS